MKKLSKTPVLIAIDDEDLNLSILDAINKNSLDWKFKAFLSPSDCLSCIRNKLSDWANKGRAVIILTDFEMPGMNWYELALEILKINKEDWAMLWIWCYTGKNLKDIDVEIMNTFDFIINKWEIELLNKKLVELLDKISKNK